MFSSPILVAHDTFTLPGTTQQFNRGDVLRGAAAYAFQAAVATGQLDPNLVTTPPPGVDPEA